VTASREIQWPPMGRISWPPSTASVDDAVPRERNEPAACASIPASALLPREESDLSEPEMPLADKYALHHDWLNETLRPA
jgi:hypothetical protein